MNEKTIIWIDDSFKDMEKAARGAFCELWKRGILNITVFFGDYSKLTEYEAKNYRDITDFCFKRLYKNCIDENNPNSIENFKELYNLKKRIVDNDLLNKQVIHLPNDSITKKSEIQNIIKSWNDDPPKMDNWINNNYYSEKYNVKFLFDEINESKEMCYALDLVLLKSDEAKLNCAEDSCEPVISMELYHYITEVLNAKCFLFSRFTYLNRLQRNWLDLYKKRYNNSDNIKIYERSGFAKDCMNYETIGDLIKLFD